MLAGLIIVASALSLVFMMTGYWWPHGIVPLTAIFGFGIGSCGYGTQDEQWRKLERVVQTAKEIGQ